MPPHAHSLVSNLAFVIFFRNQIPVINSENLYFFHSCEPIGVTLCFLPQWFGLPQIRLKGRNIWHLESFNNWLRDLNLFEMPLVVDMPN